MSGRRAAPFTLVTAALLTVTGTAAAQQAVQIPTRDRPLTERPATVFTVGAEEGESWEMLSGVRALAFDRSDNLYVLDAQNTRVLVFDARGRFQRQFGKKGGGPGEFQAPLGLAVLTDGTVAVSDLANRGFVLFSPTGEYLRNVAFGEELGMPIGRIEADPRGGVVTRANNMIRPEAGRPTADFANFVRQPLAAAGAPTTLYQVEMPAPRVTEQGERRMVLRFDPMFGARPNFGVLPDGGLAVHHQAEYAVKVLDANGRHVRTLTRDIKPRKPTKKDQEQEIERRRTAAASGGGPTMISMTAGPGGSNVQVGGGQRPAQMSFNLEDMPVAELMSTVTNVRTDPQGRIWVQRRNQDGAERGPIDIVAHDGRYIGTLPPQQLPDAVSTTGLAAYVMRDDLGVERVVVRRLPQSWR